MSERSERTIDTVGERIDVAVRDAVVDTVAAVTEVEPDELGWTRDFWEELELDSLQALEVLSALERRFHIVIDQSSLEVMRDIKSTYGVVMAARSGVTTDVG